MVKRSPRQNSSDEQQTKRSPESASSRPWTKEEQDAAVPLPLPTVPDRADIEDNPAPTQAVHSGTRGRTSPAGKPDTGPAKG